MGWMYGGGHEECVESGRSLGVLVCAWRMESDGEHGVCVESCGWLWPWRVRTGWWVVGAMLCVHGMMVASVCAWRFEGGWFLYTPSTEYRAPWRFEGGRGHGVRAGMYSLVGATV